MSKAYTVRTDEDGMALSRLYQPLDLEGFERLGTIVHKGKLFAAGALFRCKKTNIFVRVNANVFKRLENVKFNVVI